MRRLTGDVPTGILQASPCAPPPPPPTCQAPSTLCGNLCVNLNHNRNNCRSCGNACSIGESCVNGKCGRYANGSAAVRRRWPSGAEETDTSLWMSSRKPSMPSSVATPNTTDDRRTREMSANDPLMKHRKPPKKTPKTGICTLSLGTAWKVPTYWPFGVRWVGGMTLIWAFVRNLRTGSVMKREKAQVEEPRGRKYRCTGQGRTAS